MSTTTASTVTTEKTTDSDDTTDEQPATRIALGVFVILTAMTGSVLALVDYRNNGFWAAVGHATFLIGAFFAVVLCLCLVLTLFSSPGPRDNEGSTP